MAVKLTRNAFKINRSVRNNPTGATHFVRFPLYNSKSKATLEKFMRTLRDELRDFRIPQKAFRLPKSFGITMVSFRVESASALQVAVETFHRLDVRKMLACESTRGDVDPADSPYPSDKMAGRRNHDQVQQVKPLTVVLRGLHFPASKALANASKMCSFLDDPSDRLPLSRVKIRHHFKREGFVHPKDTTNTENFSLETFPSGPGLVWPELVRLGKAKQQTLIDESGQAYRRKLREVIDAWGLPERYRDLVWTENIQIEKLSFCKEDRIAKFHGPNNETLIDEDYEEIASIPLPQEC